MPCTLIFIYKLQPWVIFQSLDADDGYTLVTDLRKIQEATIVASRALPAKT